MSTITDEQVEAALVTYANFPGGLRESMRAAIEAAEGVRAKESQKSCHDNFFSRAVDQLGHAFAALNLDPPSVHLRNPEDITAITNQLRKEADLLYARSDGGDDTTICGVRFVLAPWSTSSAPKENSHD